LQLFGRSPEALIAVVLILLVSLPFHEFSHALAAYRLGDSTAKYMGRLTLNPLAHLDPFGSLLILLAGFGWAKPTPYNPYNVRGGKTGEVIIALAGPAANLVLAIAAAIPLRYITATGLAVPELVISVLETFVLLNVILAIFNLIPIPPLDGSKMLFAVMDPQTERQWRPVLEQYGFIALFAAMLLPVLPGGETIVTFIFREVGLPIINLLIGEALRF
jgi:Zn-dependent protease